VTVAVLDASALIALILDEPGADKVRDAIMADAAVTAVNLAEAVGYFARNGAAEPAIRDMLAELRLEVGPFDVELAYATGMLLPLTRRAGLSLGDRACLAFAHQRGVKAMTTDRAWSRVAGAIGVEIELIR
jgi:ribonuclease VapC